MKVGSFKIKTKKIIKIGIFISVVFIVYSVVHSGLKDKYSQDIEAYREEKNEHFKKDKSSPVEDQVGFKGLRYFEPDKKYRLVAFLKVIQDSTRDSLILFRKAGLEEGNKNYFLPFFDETNGDETYEGGRYLDIELKSEKSFVLDFNLAYSPYCVYNYRYSCPVPPKGNLVDTRILAGERMFLK